ncbi:hypothetical protein SY88_02570 [Clostridiales bacterium PH28_bin88]|nr:hypothetical protein SY88_02570 [Clostridiales bacterium PH28_bin88]
MDKISITNLDKIANRLQGVDAKVLQNYQIGKSNWIRAFTIEEEDIGYVSFTLRLLRDIDEIADKLNRTISITENLGFVLHYIARDRQKLGCLDISRMFALLYSICGQPDPFYDNYKCSFNYTFEMNLDYQMTGQNNLNTSMLLFIIRDWKGGVEFQFRRYRKGEEDNYLVPDEDTLPQKLLELIWIYLDSFLLGYYEGLTSSVKPFKSFLRVNQYCHLLYGYRRGEFYWLQDTL